MSKPNADLIARGEFEVRMESEPPLRTTDGVSLSRATVHKNFRGELVATGEVHMLAARSPRPDSAAYVAIEHIEGALAGRRGSFVAVHTGRMDRGEDSLHIEIAPDSGTDGLEGIFGEMRIDRDAQGHRYTLRYGFGEMSAPESR